MLSTMLYSYTQEVSLYEWLCFAMKGNIRMSGVTKDVSVSHLSSCGLAHSVNYWA